MSDQPNPTGEWTAEQVRKMLSDYSGERNAYQDVADSHNAALAAAETAADEFFRANGILTQQLAAEREWREQMIDQLETMHKQLAAERAKPKTTEYAQGWDDHVLAAKSQREELRSRVHTLVDALKDSRQVVAAAMLNEATWRRKDIEQTLQRIDAALAKLEPRSTRVKEGK